MLYLCGSVLGKISDVMRIQCCICADLFSEDTDIAAIQCGHVFHEHCLARWMTTANTCPSCRKRIKPNCVISKLFFDIAERFGNLSSEDISARNQVMLGIQFSVLHCSNTCFKM